MYFNSVLYYAVVDDTDAVFLQRSLSYYKNYFL